MTEPQLDTLFRSLYVRAVLLAEGKATSFDVKVKGGGERIGPQSFGESAGDFYRHYKRARSKQAKRRVLWAFIDYLRPHLIPNPPPEIGRHRGTKEWRRQVATEERAAPVVASMYGCSIRTVYRYRTEFFKLPSRHKPTPPPRRAQFNPYGTQIMLAKVSAELDTLKAA